MQMGRLTVDSLMPQPSAQQPAYKRAREDTSVVFTQHKRHLIAKPAPSFPRAQPTMMSALLPSFHEDQDCSPLITNDPMSLNPTDVSSPS